MPQIDKVGFFTIVFVITIFSFINIFCVFVLMAFPLFSAKRTLLDISKSALSKIAFLVWHIIIWPLFVIIS